MQPGTRLGPYEIIDALGQGGMGEVYRARDVRLRREVAIKTLAEHAGGNPRFHERFEREARAAAALSHPNILAIFDVGVHDGIPYLATELLEGETLRARIGGGPLPLGDIVTFGVQIGRGLSAAHDRGIVHRDLKPDNIFITRDGQIKLLDFGLATDPSPAATDETTRLEQTQQGMLLGTVGYMPPEQVRGERVDHRGDLFSFGCVLYEMATARRAFVGGSSIETLHAILTEQPTALASLRPDLPATLDGLTRRLLEKACERRVQHARDAVAALEAISKDPEARAPSSSPAAPRTRRPWLAAVAVAGALALAGATAVWFTGGKPALDAGRDGTGLPLLAVLPFETIPAAGGSAFAAGMTEEVSGRLSKLSGLRVVSRAAVSRFASPRAELAAMADELGIGSVVTGTVREDAGRLRVNVELLDARTGQVIWSNQFDREGVDVFAAQSDVALHVASALNARVTLEEQARLGKRPTNSVAAYELFVRARRPPGDTTEKRLAAAIDLLRQAVALDPRFAEAYSQIAERSYFQAAYGDLSAIARGMDAAHRALALDPKLATAHHGLAMNQYQLGRLQEALVGLRRAVALDPSYPVGLNDLGLAEFTAGRCDAALQSAKRSLALSSNTSVPYYHVGYSLMCLDDDEKTERFLTAGSTRFPGDQRLHVLLAFVDLRRGRTQAAVDRVRRLAADAPGSIEALLTRAEVLTFAGTPDAPAVVRELMDRAGDGLLHTAPYPVKLAHAYHLTRAGSAAVAGAILDGVLEANRQSLLAGADWPMVFVQNAAVRALRGDSAAALDALDRAYAAGYRDGRTLAIDPLLASLRREPRFISLLKTIAADVSVMRARADYSGLGL